MKLTTMFCSIPFPFARKVLPVLALLAVGAFAHGDVLKLKILLNGAPAGETTYEMQPDGSFKSVQTLKLGTIEVSSSVTGHIVSDRLTDFELEGQQPATGKVKMSLKGGHVKLEAGGVKRDVPWTDKTGLLFGALHPQFAAGTLLSAEKSLRANPGVPETSLSAFMIESGTVVPLKVRALPAVAVKVAGKSLNARRFAVRVGSVDIQYALDDQNRVVAVDVPAQKLRLLADGWDGLFVDPLAKYPELSQPTYKYKTESGLRMTTRDGVSLVCDVIRPDDGQRHPAILQRTPYGRSTAAPDGPFWASRGYCYVMQDCRGREDSGGEWDPLVHEGPDGYDTIQWIAKQPWCDGKVGMIGGSYDGYVQWAAAVLNPPALKCIVPQVSPPDAMHNIPYEYGTFGLYADMWWANIVATRKTNLSGTRQLLQHPEKLATLPLSKIDQAVFGKKLSFFQQWLRRETLGDWKGADFTFHLADSHVPALHVSGNWDGDGIGTFLNWDTLRKLGRTNQWIVFGPWTHAFNTTHSIGDLEYGPDAILEMDSLYLRWFDTWLKGKSVGLASVPHVKLFVTGANKWITARQWPSADMPARTLYLGPSSLNDVPGARHKIAYTYDPSKDTKIPDAIKNAKVGDGDTNLPRSVLREPATLLFSGPKLRKATAITGPFTVRLHFKSSAQNTDFYCSVLDIGPDGHMRVLGVSGKLRASYRDGTDKQIPLKPGREYVATVVPWEFAHEFAPGHRIALMLRASIFPEFARNLGTCDPIATATRMVVQHNTILTGKGHESSFTFHVLWEK